MQPPIEVMTQQASPTSLHTWEMRTIDQRLKDGQCETIFTHHPHGVFSPEQVAGLIKRAENYVRSNKRS